MTPLHKLLGQADKILGQTDLPPGVEAKVKTALQSVLNRMDIVTREEFDAQTAVLQRTRKRLETLEQALKELEAQEQQTDKLEEKPKTPDSGD